MQDPTRVSSRIEWPTLLLLAGTYVCWGLGTWVWAFSAPLSILVTGWFIAQFSSLQHEALHDHPFRNPVLNEAVVFPALALIVPYRRFRQTHLQHHFDPNLTDPYDDPESNYLDPAVWNRLPRPLKWVLRANNTLLGRITIGPLLGTFFWLQSEFHLIKQRVPGAAIAWTLNILGLVPVLIWLSFVGMPLWAYAIPVYFSFSLLRIRTFLEHRAHESCRGRTVIIEDRGPLALLFLNNNFHSVHHCHPHAPWYQLPALYEARKEHFCRRNDNYVFANYGQVFWRYLVRAKDPVPHPIWPVVKIDRPEV